MTDTNNFNLSELSQFEPDLFWENHGRKVIIITAVALVAGLAAYFWQQQREADRDKASARLAAAMDVASLQGIVKDLPDSDVAAAALLRLGDLQFREARYPDATKTLQELLQKYPKHMLADAARLGLAAVQEAVGNYEPARILYMELISASPNSYTVAPARLGAARCSELLGQAPQARQLYNEVMASDQTAAWQGEAFFRWTVLGRQVPKTAPATPNTEGYLR